MILSDPFLATHRFFIRERTDTQVGLGFEPDRFSELKFDVEGTLWLPLVADVFPVIEFRHTRYPHESELWWVGGPRQRNNFGHELGGLGDRVGGRMEMSFVPDFGWVVHDFRLRTPYARRVQQLAAGSEFRDRLRRGERPQDIPGCCKLSLQTRWLLSNICGYSVEVLDVVLDAGRGASGRQARRRVRSSGPRAQRGFQRSPWPSGDEEGLWQAAGGALEREAKLQVKSRIVCKSG